MRQHGAGQTREVAAPKKVEAEHYDIEQELREAAMEDLESAWPSPARATGWSSPASSPDERAASGSDEWQAKEPQAKHGPRAAEGSGAERRVVLERAIAPPPLLLPEDMEQTEKEELPRAASPNTFSAVHEEAVATSARQRKRSSSRGKRSKRSRSLGRGVDLEAASLVAPEDDDAMPAQPMSARDHDPTAQLTARRRDCGGGGHWATKWQAMEEDMSRCLDDAGDVDEAPFHTGSSRGLGAPSGLALRE